jgi:hypothetical protein
LPVLRNRSCFYIEKFAPERRSKRILGFSRGALPFVTLSVTFERRQSCRVKL